ncbi:MAG TPA: MFS transporter [Candidatus Dormibacteraeota bacterium]|nr:MFS transporter [Candidatus Dormibacteraeota bacterium]
MRPDDSVPPAWRTQLGVLWFSQYCTLAGATFVFPFLPLMVRTVGVHNPGAIALWSGAAVGASQLAQAGAAPFWGRVADRVGRKPMVVRATLALGLLMAVTGLAPNVYILVATRVLTGIFAGSVAATNALVASLAPRGRMTHGLGVLQSGYYIGTMSGPALGAVFVPIFGIRNAFFVAAVMPILAGVAVTLVIRESFVPRPRGVLRARTRHLVREAGIMRGLVSLLVMALLVQSIGIGLSAALPLRVGTLAGVNVAAAVGAAAALQACCAAIAALSVSRITRRFSYRSALTLLAVCAAVSYGLVALTGSLAALLLLVGLGGLFAGGMLPSVNALLGTVAPAAVRAELFGYNASAMAAGGAVAPLLSGILAAGFGTGAPFLMVAGLEVSLAGWAFIRLGARSGLPASARPVAAVEVAQPIIPVA